MACKIIMVILLTILCCPLFAFATDDDKSPSYNDKLKEAKELLKQYNEKHDVGSLDFIVLGKPAINVLVDAFNKEESLKIKLEIMDLLIRFEDPDSLLLIINEVKKLDIKTIEKRDKYFYAFYEQLLKYYDRMRSRDLVFDYSGETLAALVAMASGDKKKIYELRTSRLKFYETFLSLAENEKKDIRFKFRRWAKKLNIDVKFDDSLSSKQVIYNLGILIFAAGETGKRLPILIMDSIKEQLLCELPPYPEKNMDKIKINFLTWWINMEKYYYYDKKTRKFHISKEAYIIRAPLDKWNKFDEDTKKAMLVAWFSGENGAKIELVEKMPELIEQEFNTKFSLDAASLFSLSAP